MSDLGQHQSITARVRVLRIIILAMAAGIVIFLAVILTVPGLARPLAPEKQARIVTYIAAAYGGLALVLAPLVSAGVVSSARRRIAQSPPTKPRNATLVSPAAPLLSAAGNLASLYVVKTLLSAALYEGATLFLAVAYMLGRNPAALIIAAVLLLALLWQVPTADRAQRWLDGQVRQMGENRSTWS